LLEKLREDRLHVAFVAEFSRGKSELINAIFFAGYGNRILPSTAGRTTMCPTELMFDKSKAPSIELLPIESRESNASISEYKRFADEWTSRPDRHRFGRSHAGCAAPCQRRHPRRPRDRRGSALRSCDGDSAVFRVDQDGNVEIPRWRHAVINFPHPLLQQGLVILDTPGLNAIGTEPELTLSLLPNAHAVLFILAADTGVTQSDLTVWREHIGTRAAARRGASSFSTRSTACGTNSSQAKRSTPKLPPGRYLCVDAGAAREPDFSGLGTEGAGRQDQRRSAELLIRSRLPGSNMRFPRN
jgi:hypothetical protein